MSVGNPKPRINIEKFAQWLKEKTKTSECPFCKGNHWEAINGSHYVGCAIPFGDGRGDMYMSGYPVLPLVCAQCKFVRNVALTEELLELTLEDEQIAPE